MIAVLFDLDSGVAKLALPATIKLGADVPVAVVFSRAPGAVSALELALGQADATAAVLAFTETFDQENDTTWLATLDASDTRLATFMAGEATANVNAELVAVIDGLRQVSANLSVTVQIATINGSTTAQGPFAWLIKAANYTAQSGDAIQADTSGGAFTITLPPAPTIGDAVAIEDATASFATHHLTIARNGLKVNGSAADYTASTVNATLRATYISSAYGWSIK